MQLKNRTSKSAQFRHYQKLTHRRIVVKDPDRWHIVKKLFELYLTGNYSVPEITGIASNVYGYRTIKRPKKLAVIH